MNAGRIDAALAERERVANERLGDIIRTILINRKVDENAAVDFAVGAFKPALAEWGAVCANEALEKAAQHEPKLYFAQGPVTGENGTYTFASLGCTCGWNSEGKAPVTDTFGSHIRALKAEG